MKKFILVLLMFFSVVMVAQAESRFVTVINNPSPFVYQKDNVYSSCDPFYVKIGNNKYYLVSDKGDNYTYKDMLGCSWPKSSLFEPLRLLDTNNDKKVTSEELKSANIRFVKLQIGRTLALKDKSQDYNIDNIDYIDLKWLRLATVGLPLGSFDIYFKNKERSLKHVMGKVSQLEPYYAKKMIRN